MILTLAGFLWVATGWAWWMRLHNSKSSTSVSDVLIGIPLCAVIGPILVVAALIEKGLRWVLK